MGLDVHKASITIAVADEGRGEPAVLATIPNDGASLWKQVRRLGPKENLRFCYEAGPTGYGVYRDLKARGMECGVVAPALVPQQKGGRVKTDRRDAAKLARLLRSGDLTSVYVPDEATEALRDLVRARFDAKKAERVARAQLFHFLLRHGRRYPGKTAWTKTHQRWIQSLRFEHEAQERVLSDYLHVVEEAAERIQRLEDDVADAVQGWSLLPLVQALQALRGVRLVAAATVAAELGDISRFERRLAWKAQQWLHRNYVRPEPPPVSPRRPLRGLPHRGDPTPAPPGRPERPREQRARLRTVRGTLGNSLGTARRAALPLIVRGSPGRIKNCGSQPAHTRLIDRRSLLSALVVRQPEEEGAMRV